MTSNISTGSVPAAPVGVVPFGARATKGVALPRARVSFWERFGPIIIAEGYLSFTVFIFAFGPWPWPVNNPLTLYSYLIAVQIVLFLGFLSGRSPDGSAAFYTGRLTSQQLLKASVILNLLWIIPYFYLQIGSDAFSLRGIIDRTLHGVVDPRQAYIEKLQNLGTRDTLVLYAYQLCSPILWLAVPIAVRAWGSISVKMKAAVGIILLANTATWIALGTTKGVADNTAIIVISVLATRRSTGRFRKTLRHFSRMKRVGLVLAAAAALVVYFSYNESSRRLGQLSRYDSGAGVSVDTNNIFMAGLPVQLQAAEANGVAYLCQGYYGLSLALQEPFVWSYGVGHSAALASLVHKLTGFDATNLTYMAREQHAGWDMQLRWDSIYPWLASDVTFPGTLVVIFLVGRLLALVWADARVGQHPYALSLLVLVMIGIFYFPANDQILSSSISIWAFWGLLFLWLANRTTNLRVRVQES